MQRSLSADMPNTIKKLLIQQGYTPDSALSLAILHSTPLNIYAKDINGEFIFVNSCYCESVDKTYNDILGYSDFDLHPVEYADKYRADDKRVMMTRQTESINELWVLRDNETRAYITTIKAPLIENSEVIGTIGIFWDITEKQQIELDRAEERNLLRNLLDALPVSVYIKDLESHFQLANKTAAKFFGAEKPEELLQQKDENFVTASQSIRNLVEDEQIIRTGVPILDQDEEVNLEDENVKHLMTSKFPLRNLEDEIAGIIGVSVDITNRRKAELKNNELSKQLLHAQKMESIGTLVGGIAHDFNNQLSIINGYAELLKLQTEEGSKLANAANQIHEAAQNSAKLIRQLMAFGRKQTIQPEVISPAEMLEALQEIFSHVIDKNIHIDIQFDENLWNVKLDRIQLDQIIINLVTNSRDAMPSGGTLNIFASNITLTEEPEPNTFVRFVVQDSGCGMNEETLQQLFDPYFTTKERFKGTGLGLSTVHGIVTQNNGRIAVRSKIGTGSTFTVDLPSTQEATTEVAEVAETCVLTSSARVAIVEDQPEVLELLKCALEADGFRVIAASSGEHLLELLRFDTTPPQLLLTDVILPGINGKILSEELRRALPELKVIFMSGYSDDLLMDDDLQNLSTAFIQKPFNTSELFTSIKELLST